MLIIVIVVGALAMLLSQKKSEYPIIPGTQHPSVFNEGDYLTQHNPVTATPGNYDGGSFTESYLYNPGKVTPFTKPTPYKYH